MDTSTFVNRKGQRIDAAYHPAPHPRYLALLGHGVTGNKDRPLMVGIASELADRGVPSLRFSFAGNGKSGGKFEEATITSETEDLVDLLKLVASLDDWKDRKGNAVCPGAGAYPDVGIAGGHGRNRGVFPT